MVGKRLLTEGEVHTSAWPASDGRGSTAGPSSSSTRRPPSAAMASAELVSRPGVVDGHPGAAVGQEARQRDAAAGEAEDGHRSAGERVEVEARRGRWARRGATATGVTRSVPGVPRKKATPTSAESTPTIQKRSVIFSSCQPISSKW